MIRISGVLNRAIQFLSVLCICFVAAMPTSNASGYGHPYNRGQVQAPDPGKLLREGIDKMTRYLASGSADPAQFRQFVDNEIAVYFDFDYMSRWASGPRYRHMSQAEKQQVSDLIKSMFMSSMVKLLADYSPGRVQFLPVNRNYSDREVKLSLVSYPKQGYPTRVDFRLYQSPQGWRVFDVAANGQSAVVYYRNYLKQQFRRQQNNQRSYRGQPGYQPGYNNGYRGQSGYRNPYAR